MKVLVIRRSMFDQSDSIMWTITITHLIVLETRMSIWTGAYVVINNSGVVRYVHMK